MIVAQSERGLLPTFKEVYKRDKDATPTKYYVGTIVDLPADVIEAIRVRERKSQLSNFQHMVQCEAGHWFFKFGKLPLHVKACTCFPKNTSELDEYNIFWTNEDEEYCKECDNLRIIITKMTWDEAFTQHCPDWDKYIPSPSDREIAEPIYVAQIGGGPRSGANIVPLNKEHFNWGRYDSMFAFTGEEKPVPAFVSEWLSEAVRADFNAKEESSAKYRNAAAIKRLEHRAKVFKSIGYSEEEIREAMIILDPPRKEQIRERLAQYKKESQ